MTKDEIREREKEKVMSDVIGNTRVGVMEKIPNMKSRQRSIYYRPVKNEDGTVAWLETLPLPSDAQGRELYLSKGFRLNPPKDEPESEPEPSEREALLTENALLKKQLQMAKAREARGKKESLSGTLSKEPK